MPRFLTRVMCSFAAYLALSAACSGQDTASPLPSPESVLGYKAGADYHLATYDETLKYFRALDAASDSMILLEAGSTSQGRAWYYSVISSPRNLARLDELRSISLQLAHPDGLSDEQAHKLARKGKAFVHIDGGMHASEVAGPQHTMLLAYDLLRKANEPKYKRILDEVVFFLWPTINPDGQQMVSEWYMSNVGTEFETASLPRLYQKYVGHDNNRDAYMLNMIESRVIGRTWRYWEPQITHVHHQTAPFPTRIWLPPFAEPIASHAPPLISRTVNMIGMAMAYELDAASQPGATHMGTGFDAWYPGYTDYLPVLQNIASFWTETALYTYATPRYYEVSSFPPAFRDLRPQSLYASPWKGGWWRLRDAVEYMETASIGVLDFAARYREELLYNRYQAGRDVIARYRTQGPYAYFIPQDQTDLNAPVEMLRRLAFNGVRVYQLTEAAREGGRTFPKGTWVVPMDQEFAQVARELLDVQTYPDLREYRGGPPEQPYDAAGWTLPLQMNVETIAADEPLADSTRAAMQLVQGKVAAWREAGDADASSFDTPPDVGFDSDPVASGIVPLAGSVTGAGPSLLLDPAQNNSFRAMGRARALGARVSFSPANESRSARYVVDGLSNTQQETITTDLHIRAERGATPWAVRVTDRIALFRPHSSMDEGWTRWVLERFEMPFTSLWAKDFNTGPLRERFDTIIFSSERLGSVTRGYRAGTMPAQYVGGIGDQGVEALRAFVNDGGTVVALNGGCMLAIEAFELPVANVTNRLSRSEYFAVGSILKVTTNQQHPIMAGMPEQASIYFDRSPVFTTLDGFDGCVLAKYQPQGSPLQSGYLLGEKYLNGYAAALDVNYGKGHVVLLGFRPQWRGQPFGSFKVLFNAANYTLGVPAYQPATGFWTRPIAAGHAESSSGDE